MIGGDPAAAAAERQSSERRVTIDDIFRRIAASRSGTLALADAPNRQVFAGGAPRRLTYAEADRMVSAIAGRLRDMGLPAGAVIGVQLPNIVENILTILGVLRAGMIVAPLPLLWRRADAVTALTSIGAKALITCGHVGGFDHCQSALRIAADVFSIRYVCGFGANLPDGVVPFDDLFATAKRESMLPPDREPQGNPAARIALVSFEVGGGGIVPVARNHLEMLAGGLGVLLESRLAQNSSILSTIAPVSFAGICLTLLPWLLSGSILALHHPFDPAVFARQRRDDRCGTLILPGPVALRLADAGVLAGEEIHTIIAAWRAPEKLAMSQAWGDPATRFVDVAIFGEAGVVAARRAADGRPAPISFGPVVAPRGSSGGVLVAELMRTETNTVALRGPMVPHRMFPPGIERSGAAHFKIDGNGLVDTGYTCRVNSMTDAMVVTGPPAGIVSVGGYRFRLGALQEAAGRLDRTVTLAALPDPLLGHRLIGNAANRGGVEAALTGAGVNPLIAAAFHDRSALDKPAREKAARQR